jgi:hypothetical protein
MRQEIKINKDVNFMYNRYEFPVLMKNVIFWLKVPAKRINKAKCFTLYLL